jgi:hypothetical protein
VTRTGSSKAGEHAEDGVRGKSDPLGGGDHHVPELANGGNLDRSCNVLAPLLLLRTLTPVEVPEWETLLCRLVS